MSSDSLSILLLITVLFLGIATIAALFLAYKYLSVRGKITEQARREFEQWRAREISGIKQESLEIAHRESRVELEQWKRNFEQGIRQDAIQKSQAVTLGKVTEHFIPYLPDFRFNPKDARFMGSPIDFVVFDGLNDGDIRKIVFVEVKTGTSALTTRERRIRDAIQAGNIEWLELRPAIRMGISSNGITETQVELSKEEAG
jgi:predicted Holliday junction resolvase-like endonuclease